MLYTAQPSKHGQGSYYQFAVNHDPTPVMGTYDAIKTGSWLGLFVAWFPWGKVVPAGIKRKFTPGSNSSGDIVHTHVDKRGNSTDVTRTMEDGSTRMTRYQIWDRGVDQMIADGAPAKWYKGGSLTGKSVLDAPAGPGHRLAKELQGSVGPKGRSVGLEISPAYRAQGVGVQGDMVQMPFADGSFDVVFQHFGPLTYVGRGTGSTAESAEVGLKVLQETMRVLRPGGKLRIFPVSNDEFFQLLQRAGLRYVRDGRAVEIIR